MASNLDTMLIMLGRGIAQRRLYFAKHPRVRELGDQFTSQLADYFAETGERSFFLGVVDGQLVHEGRALHGPSVMAGALVHFVERCHAGGIVFNAATTSQEVQDFVTIAATETEVPESLQDARVLLAERGIVNIELAAEYKDPLLVDADDERRAWQGRETCDHDLPSPVLVYQALFDVVTAANACATTGRTLDIDGARAACEHLIRCAQSNFTDMMQLMQYPDYDSYTVGHSVRVAALTVYVGDQLGLNAKQLLILGTAALLHDVGKSRIPDEILFKPGKLDPDEYAVMQSHARLGAELLLEHRNITPVDVAAAWGHHLRHDGGGYPAMPSWAARSPGVALIQICDVYEALTAVRPYKKPMSPLRAFEIMLGDQGAFDPGLLAAFVGRLGLYPPGSEVRLSDGRFGTVTVPGPDIASPTVRVTHDPAGQLLPRDEQLELDLGEAADQGLMVAELLTGSEALVN